MEAEINWTGYEQAANDAKDHIRGIVGPVWALAKRTPWRDDFLAEVFRWGALVSDVPIVVVPLSTEPSEVLERIKANILRKRQRFPLLQRYLRWRFYKLDTGITGFQANWAVNNVIADLLGDGFVAFVDEARMYPQYADKALLQYKEAWGILDGSIPDSLLWRVLGKLSHAASVANFGLYVTDAYRIRAHRADKRLKEAWAYVEYEVAPVRKWLQLRFPQYDWKQWHGDGYMGTKEVVGLLERVNAYCDRKDSATEERAAWKQSQRVNDERLRLWREWWQKNVVGYLRRN